MKAPLETGGRPPGQKPAGGVERSKRAPGLEAFALSDLYALVFGLFLGVAVIKFGNPVILDRSVTPPAGLHEVWSYAWPTHWARWFLVPLTLAGLLLAVRLKPRWPGTRWLWRLPLAWFGWQLVAATATVDRPLSSAVLWQLGGCLAGYFLGVLVLGTRRRLSWLLIGLLAAFAFCLVRASNQKLVDFPREYRFLLESEQTGWTNVSPELLLELERDQVIINTNGMMVANPVIVAKYAKGRVMGTLIYPNALASIILLLWSLSFVIALQGTRVFRRVTRALVVSLVCFLGSAGLFWSGSKFGWLIAMGLVMVWLLRLDWPNRWKCAMVGLVFVVGLGAFALRFHNYFARGATSVGARFDYWHAAVRNTLQHPMVGSGPGTFQRPYARLKAPEAEMTRLVHNDYLEQFTDSGIPGGLVYLTWIALALGVTGRRSWRSKDLVQAAVFLGLLGWYIQGLAEFSLYVPALALPAFTLLGWLIAKSGAEQNNSVGG